MSQGKRIKQSLIKVKGALIGAALTLAIFTLAHSARFDFIETKLADVRFQLARTEPTAQIVIVAIDAHSLQARPIWPWPRSWHAQLIDHLLDAGAAQIAIDIDFSAASSPSEDAALAAALQRGGERIILPVFQQISQHQTGFVTPSAPAAEFLTGVRIGSANVLADRDGIVRQMQRFEHWAGTLVPTIPTAIMATHNGDTEPFFIDFGIKAENFTIVSYSDVLAGNVDPEMFLGKVVMIGATARELGDILSTPVSGVSPGVVVQALATASLLQDRALHRLPLAATFPLALCLYILVELTSRRLRWTGVLLLSAGLVMVVFLGTVATQKALAIAIDAAPLIITIVVSCVVSLIGRIQELDVRVLSSALALRRTDNLMRQVVANMGEGLLTLDGNGIVKSANPAVERILQRDLPQILGTPIANFIAGLSPVNMGSWLDCVAEQHQTQEISLVGSSGKPITAEVTITRLPDEATANYIALVRDIGKRKAASAAAARNQARLRDAIECVAGGFILFDAEEKLLACNEQFRDLYPEVKELLIAGCGAGDLFRSQITLANPDMSAADGEQALTKRLSHFRSASKPFEIKTGSGRWLLVDERRTSEGGVVAIHTDITAVKRHEAELRSARDQAEAANRSKSQFLANMSHELRTPLNAVIGFSEVMRGEMLGPIGTPAYRNYAADIHDSATHLLSIINDILDISSIESGAPRLREEIVSPAGICESISKLMADRLQRGRMTLGHSTEEVGGQLWADPRLLKQMLINLVSNAIKFSAPGTSVRLSVEETPDRAITFTVSDQGIGIAAKDLARILRPFEQVESAFERCHDGVGLGLPLVQAMANLHQAALEIASTPGQGTTVTLRFPPARYRAAPCSVTQLESHCAARLA